MADPLPTGRASAGKGAQLVEARAGPSRRLRLTKVRAQSTSATPRLPSGTSPRTSWRRRQPVAGPFDQRCSSRVRAVSVGLAAPADAPGHLLEHAMLVVGAPPGSVGYSHSRRQAVVERSADADRRPDRIAPGARRRRSRGAGR
jgi:hypothetical protein